MDIKWPRFSNRKKVAGGSCKVAGALSHCNNGGLAGWGAGTQKVPVTNAWSSQWLALGAG